MDKSFSTCFKNKDIVIPLAFVSDETIPFFTTQSVILQFLYYASLSILFCEFWGIHLNLMYIKLKSYRDDRVN